MYNRRVTEGITASGNRRRASDSYDCSNHKLRALKTSVSCFNHYISTAALREIVLFTIREISVYAISNREEFIEKVRQASAVKQEQTAKELKRQLNKDKKRLTELDFLYKKLYESYAVGKIPEDKFEFLSGEYLAEQTELQNSIAENEVEICKYEDDTARVGQFLELAEKYTDFTELTTPMINEFIDKILVHSADRNNGPRTQEVEIYLKFIGQFEIPQRELTEEELEQMRIKKYWQDRYWKHRDYELNRRKKQKEMAKAEEISDFSPKMQENVVQ